jgi:DNA-binding SARP family transcriptional activator
LDFRVLGPLEVTSDNGRLIPIPRPRERALLSVLLLNADNVITHDQLIAALWGHDLPRDPRGAIRSYVYNLRKNLRIHDRLRTLPVGYAMRLHNGDRLDLTRFRELLKEAAGTDRQDLSAYVRLLQRAADLWRPPPLVDVPVTPAVEPYIAELVERRSFVDDQLVSARLALGQHSALLPTLAARTVSEPLRETHWARLMVALYRSGRQAEALGTYTRVREIFVKELGIGPGPELQDLHHRMLVADPALVPRQGGLLTADATVPMAGSPVPRSPADEESPISEVATRRDAAWPPRRAAARRLPQPTANFVGRQSELALLSDLAATACDGEDLPIIAAISGSPGVGKTSLAIQFLHQAAEMFPDGQLYVDLKGFGPSGQPLGLGDAVHELITGLRVPKELIPPELDNRVAMYRRLVAERRVMVVADNALHSAQIQPLMPVNSGSMLLATSRAQLTSLVQMHGAQEILLDIFSETEAVDFLAHAVGEERRLDQPAALTQLADYCARLPLALAVVGEHAAAEPGLPLERFLASLRSGPVLNALASDGDSVPDVRRVFSWSYVTLTNAAARMFRSLGRHLEPDITVTSAARLAGFSFRLAGRALAELARASLLSEWSPGRFSFHNLLKAYAAERAALEEMAG